MLLEQARIRRQPRQVRLPGIDSLALPFVLVEVQTAGALGLTLQVDDNAPAQAGILVSIR